nr:hypothetical protein [Vibrio qinghaiensis]
MVTVLCGSLVVALPAP